MNKTFVAVITVAVLAVLAGAWYFRPADLEPSQQAVEQRALPVPPEVDEEPVIRHPVPRLPAPVADKEAVQEVEQQVAQAIDNPADPASGETAPAEPPLPELDESDGALRGGLAEIAVPGAFEPLFNLDNIIRRFVVTIDNMPGGKLPQRHVLNKPAAGPFLAAGEEGEEFIDPENYRRYTPYIRLLESLDTQSVAGLYIRFYPLFQAAYVDLGYPSGYFNDRLIEVIDHLLAAPEVQGRIRLVRPHVLYKFADPDLESLSAGQKVLIRIGHDNAVRVKAKLRGLRRALTVREAAP